MASDKSWLLLKSPDLGICNQGPVFKEGIHSLYFKSILSSDFSEDV